MPHRQLRGAPHRRAPSASTRPRSISARPATPSRRPARAPQAVRPGAVSGDVTLPDQGVSAQGAASRGATSSIARPRSRCFAIASRTARDTIALDTLAVHGRAARRATSSRSRAAADSDHAALSNLLTTATSPTVSGQSASAPPGTDALLIDLPSTLRSQRSRHARRPATPRLRLQVPRARREERRVREARSGARRARTRGSMTVGRGAEQVLARRADAAVGARRGSRSSRLQHAGRPARRTKSRRRRTRDRRAAAHERHDSRSTSTPARSRGPQLHALGNDLENVNPYGGWLHRSCSRSRRSCMRVLLWMKADVPRELRLGARHVRRRRSASLLWPLNQKAMRTSMQMQRLQPELAEVQKTLQERSGEAARGDDEAVPRSTA